MFLSPQIWHHHQPVGNRVPSAQAGPFCSSHSVWREDLCVWRCERGRALSGRPPVLCTAEQHLELYRIAHDRWDRCQHPLFLSKRILLHTSFNTEWSRFMFPGVALPLSLLTFMLGTCFACPLSLIMHLFFPFAGKVLTSWIVLLQDIMRTWILMSAFY